MFISKVPISNSSLLSQIGEEIAENPPQEFSEEEDDELYSLESKDSKHKDNPFSLNVFADIIQLFRNNDEGTVIFVCAKCVNDNTL